MYFYIYESPQGHGELKDDPEATEGTAACVPSANGGDQSVVADEVLPTQPTAGSIPAVGINENKT
jgi:hypothetical protein